MNKMYATNKIGVEFDEAIFNDFRHYGQILKRDDFNFTEDNIFISMFVIYLDNEKRLFILRNGKVVHNELLK